MHNGPCGNWIAEEGGAKVAAGLPNSGGFL